MKLIKKIFKIVGILIFASFLILLISIGYREFNEWSTKKTNIENSVSETTSLWRMEDYMKRVDCDGYFDDVLFQRIFNEKQFESLVSKLKNKIISSVVEASKDESNWPKKMLGCVNNIGSRLPEFYQQSDSANELLIGLKQASKDFDFKKLGEDYNEKLNAYEKLVGEIAGFKEYSKDVYFLQAYMVAQLDKNTYEIAWPYTNKRAVLLTKETTFQSKGDFSIFAKKEGSVPVQLNKTSGGFDAKWTVYTEEPDYTQDRDKNKKNMALIGKAKKEFDEIDSIAREAIRKQFLIFISRYGLQLPIKK